MKPRDWKWDHWKKRIVLLDCPLPPFYDNIRDYKHAHRMWCRAGRWKLDSMEEAPINPFGFNIFRVYTRLIKHNWRMI
jgi:hypothetical protein